MFFLIGAADILLVWYPPSFGSAEFEFGSVTQTLNSLPLPTLGLMFLLASGIARGNRRVARFAAVMLALLALVIVLLAVLYALTVPVALQANVAGAARTGLKKSMAKTGLQAVLYPIAFAVIAVKAFRHTSASRQGAV